LAIEFASYGWEDARGNSGGWISAGRSQGAGGEVGGGWLSGLSAASVAPPAPVERGWKDMSDSNKDEVPQCGLDEKASITSG